MAYSDPDLIRTHVSAVRLNDEEMKIVQAAAAKLGMPVSTFAREAILDALQLTFDMDVDS